MKTARENCRAFTRLELLMVLATLALVTAVTRPLWASKDATRSLVCMDNHRRLAAGWLALANDNDGRLVANLHGGAIQAGAISSNWVLGWLDWTTATVNTNSAYVSDPRYSALATYVGRDASLFRCPEDEYVSKPQASRGWSARIRSYSMNGNMGPGNSKDLFGPGYMVYENLGDFRKLPPSQAFVFMEEHPDSLNDPCFFVNLTQSIWTDIPAAFHEGAAWFSFADGHVELRRWQSARTIVPIRVSTFPSQSPLPPTDPDYLWMKARATERY